MVESISGYVSFFQDLLGVFFWPSIALLLFILLFKRASKKAIVPLLLIFIALIPIVIVYVNLGEIIRLFPEYLAMVVSFFRNFPANADQKRVLVPLLFLVIAIYGYLLKDVIKKNILLILGVIFLIFLSGFVIYAFPEGIIKVLLFLLLGAALVKPGKQ